MRLFFQKSIYLSISLSIYLSPYVRGATRAMTNSPDAMQARLDTSDLAELALTAAGSEWRFVDLVQPVAGWPLLLLQSASTTLC